MVHSSQLRPIQMYHRYYFRLCSRPESDWMYPRVRFTIPPNSQQNPIYHIPRTGALLWVHGNLGMKNYVQCLVLHMIS